MQYSISQLAIYPLKSAAGETLSQMKLDERGPAYDRSWMVVDHRGQFVTQRKAAAMCLIETTVLQGAISLSAPSMPNLLVSADVTVNDNRQTKVVVWGDIVDALDCGEEAALWLSEYLKRDCRMVYMPEKSKRLVDPRYATRQQTVGFADGFPLLITSEASLQSFNANLTKHGSSLQIKMERFRPNIVISGCDAYAEDSWRKIKIGEITFSLVKPCSRCIIPAINPATGEIQSDIITVLNNTRRRQHNTYFGQNALHASNGVIRLDDTVTVLE